MALITILEEGINDSMVTREKLLQGMLYCAEYDITWTSGKTERQCDYLIAEQPIYFTESIACVEDALLSELIACNDALVKVNKMFKEVLKDEDSLDFIKKITVIRIAQLSFTDLFNSRLEGPRIHEVNYDYDD